MLDLNMDKKALTIVDDYVNGVHREENLLFETYIVWKCKTLHHWKFLISTTIEDDLYYELTYNGIKNEWYLDKYHKEENIVIKE